MRKIKVGSYYKHFKGNIYKVIDIVTDCDTLEDVVIYEAQYGENKKWARKYKDFASLVDNNKYPLVEQKYRFEEVKM